MNGLRPFVLGLVVLGVTTATAAPQSKNLEDLMMDLHIVPLDPQAPPTLSVVALDGGRVTLADVKGHAVLVYFWATW